MKFGGRSFSLSCHLTGNPESGAADGYCNFGNLEIMKTFSNKGIVREWRLTKASWKISRDCTTLKIYQADEKKAREMDEESQRFRTDHDEGAYHAA